MTFQRVREQIYGAALGYLTGFGALLVWPNCLGANQDAVFLVGVAIVALVSFVVDWRVFKHPPSIEFRPWRYSFPNFLGFLGGLLFVTGLRSGEDPERGMIGYAVGILLVLAGNTASNLWWAHATSRSGDFPA